MHFTVLFYTLCTCLLFIYNTYNEKKIYIYKSHFGCCKFDSKSLHMCMLKVSCRAVRSNLPLHHECKRRMVAVKYSGLVLIASNMPNHLANSVILRLLSNETVLLTKFLLD